MITRSVSLKLRQVIILVALLLIALPALFFSIGKAYYVSLQEATEHTLSAHMYTLMGELQFDQNNKLYLPATLIARDLNRVNSSTFAFVYQSNKLAWRSESTLNDLVRPDTNFNEGNKPSFHRFRFGNQVYWQLSFKIIMETNDEAIPVTFYLIKADSALHAMMDGFHQTLIYWLCFMAIALALLMSIGFIWSARPLHSLDNAIMEIESGKREEISGRYPIELHTIITDLNLLLSSQARRKERYRASLSDLAHALKTPLAVLNSSKFATDPEAQEQLDRINLMIEHQLKRAASGGTDTWKKHIPILPVASSIKNAMSKVYKDRDIEVTLDIVEEHVFSGDQTDLLELIGNLVDNACKACKSQVLISSMQNSNTVIIRVEDDGDGVPQEDRALLLQRGKRLDTYEQGHGIGMAIVSDLVESYQGSLQIDQSVLGGALFEIRFNL